MYTTYPKKIHIDDRFTNRKNTRNEHFHRIRTKKKKNKQTNEKIKIEISTEFGFSTFLKSLHARVSSSEIIRSAIRFHHLNLEFYEYESEIESILNLPTKHLEHFDDR